jgi:lysozyme family protein
MVVEAVADAVAEAAADAAAEAPDNFARCFAFTVGVEGGFTSNAADPGNWTGGALGAGQLRGTNFGISAAAYPNLDIAHLTEADAEAIYRRDYWAQLHGDELPRAIALVGFDAAVNAGARRSIIWLQQAAGCAADGVLGPATLAALRHADPGTIAHEALARRLDFSARLPAWHNFGLGWARRLIALAAALTQ